jgi:tetratricopeptide (TPR) repeat protein
MQRSLLLVAILTASLLASSTAEAGWGHRGCGWGGHRGVGWGGYRSVGWNSCGWSGWGGSRWGGWNSGWCGPSVGLSVGYCPPVFSYNYCSPGFGGGYCAPGYLYAPRTVGFYQFYGSSYNPNANFATLAVDPRLVDSRPAARPAGNAISPVVVRRLLAMDRDALLAALRTPPADRGGLVETTITLDRGTARPSSAVVGLAPGGADVASDMAADRAGVRISNAVQRQKAVQLLTAGDKLYREMQYHSALQRYKLAARTAPDLAEAYWRQGHALIATGNYGLASGAFKRALAINPSIDRGGFVLDDLYGDALVAKTAHIEGLAGWAIEQTGFSDPYFAMGVTLWFDGQQDRSGKFFAKASELAGMTGSYLAAFESGPPIPPAPGLFAPDDKRPLVDAAPPAGLPVIAEVEI